MDWPQRLTWYKYWFKRDHLQFEASIPTHDPLAGRCLFISNLKHCNSFFPDYYYSDFISLQGSVDRAILAELGKADVEEDIDFYLERFPYPPYRDDVFVFVIQMQFPFIILLSFIVTAPSISKDIVLEKERKLKVCHVSPLLICRAVLLGLNLLTPSNKLLKLGHVRGQGSLSSTWSPFTFFNLNLSMDK